MHKIKELRPQMLQIFENFRNRQTGRDSNYDTLQNQSQIDRKTRWQQPFEKFEVPRDSDFFTEKMYVNSPVRVIVQHMTSVLVMSVRVEIAWFARFLNCKAENSVHFTFQEDLA